MDIVVSIVPFGIAIFLFREIISISLMGVLYSIPIIMAVFFLYYNIDSFIGSLAFWMENVSGIAYFKWLLFGFFAGRLFPIELFPHWFLRILEFLPFPYMVYYPVKIIAGQILDLRSIILKFMILMGWALLFRGLNKLSWWFGMRRYSAIGG